MSVWRKKGLIQRDKAVLKVAFGFRESIQAQHHTHLLDGVVGVGAAWHRVFFFCQMGWCGLICQALVKGQHFSFSVIPISRSLEVLEDYQLTCFVQCIFKENSLPCSLWEKLGNMTLKVQKSDADGGIEYGSQCFLTYVPMKWNPV